MTREDRVYFYGRPRADLRLDHVWVIDSPFKYDLSTFWAKHTNRSLLHAALIKYAGAHDRA